MCFCAGGCQHNHRRLQTKIFANPSIIQFLFCGSQHSRSPPIYSMFIHQHVSFGGGGLHCHAILDSSSLSHSFSLASWHNHLSVRGLCLICEPYSMPCSSNNVVTIIIILLNPGDTIHPSNAKWLVINSDLRLIFDLIVCCRIYCNSPLCNSRTLQLLCRCCCCCPSHVFMYSFQTRRPKAMRPLLNIII